MPIRTLLATSTATPQAQAVITSHLDYYTVTSELVSLLLLCPLQNVFNSATQNNMVKT